MWPWTACHGQSFAICGNWLHSTWHSVAQLLLHIGSLQPLFIDFSHVRYLATVLQESLSLYIMGRGGEVGVGEAVLACFGLGGLAMVIIGIVCLAQVAQLLLKANCPLNCTLGALLFHGFIKAISRVVTLTVSRYRPAPRPIAVRSDRQKRKRLVENVL